MKPRVAASVFAGVLLGAIGLWFAVGQIWGGVGTEIRSSGHAAIEYPIPEFATFDEMQTFIAERHDRLGAFADRSPEDDVYAMVSPTGGLTKEDIAAIERGYGLHINFVEFTAGRVQGGYTITPSATLARLEERVGAPLSVRYFKVLGCAADVAALSRDGSMIALVFADYYLDKLEGLIAEDALIARPRSIFDDYQRLGPGASDPPPVPTFRPISPPNR